MGVHVGGGSRRDRRLRSALLAMSPARPTAGMAVNERRCCWEAVSELQPAPQRLRRCNGAVSLVLVGSGQVARLQAFAHIGRDAAHVVELAACGLQFGTCPLPGPPRFAHGSRNAQLGRRGPAFDGTTFGIGQCLAATPLPRQPHRIATPTSYSRVPRLRFRRSVLVDSSMATGSGVNDWAACAWARAVSLRAVGPALQAVAPKPLRRLRATLPGPAPWASPRSARAPRAGREQCRGKCQAQGGVSGVWPPLGSQNSSSVHPMLQC